MSEQYNFDTIRPLIYLSFLVIILITMLVFKDKLDTLFLVMALIGFIAFVVVIELTYRMYLLKLYEKYSGIMFIESTTILNEKDFFDIIFAFREFQLTKQLNQSDLDLIQAFYNLNESQKFSTDEFQIVKGILLDTMEFPGYPNEFKEVFIIVDNIDYIRLIPEKRNSIIYLKKENILLKGIEGYADFSLVCFIESKIPMLYLYNSPLYATNKKKELDSKVTINTIENLYKSKLVEISSNNANYEQIIKEKNLQMEFIEKQKLLAEVKSDIIQTEYFENPDKYENPNHINISKGLVKFLLGLAILGIIMLGILIGGKI